MPCYTPPYTEAEERELKTSQILGSLLRNLGFSPERIRATVQGVRAEVKLCEVMRTIKEHHPQRYEELQKNSARWAVEVMTWWREHQVQDNLFEGRPGGDDEVEQRMLRATVKKLTRAEAALVGQLALWDELNAPKPKEPKA